MQNSLGDRRKAFHSQLAWKIVTACLLGFLVAAVYAQDTVRYTGEVIANVDYHDGQLSPAVGVHNIQVLRANREHPEQADKYGWTYNHGPNMAYWQNTFFVQYLSNPVGEHIPPGQVLIAWSKDGYKWSRPQLLFPLYKVPDGSEKKNYPGVADDLYAVLHQRMGFFVSSDDRLLTLAYYGFCLDDEDSPNDGQGIGRVVREIQKDGSLGPIYFIRYNSGWNKKNTQYPFYKSSPDKGFVKACEELLSQPLMMQQWVEEADRDDPLIPLKKQYKAFSYYHLQDGRTVGLWKHALTSISNDDGRSWDYLPLRAPGFVNKNAKIWGQRTTDGRYATVYNPSQFRWPLAISTSEDGLEYTSLLLVNGEITTMRYGGQHKSYGPQYVRGILEGNGVPPDSNLWVTYSMNKEDIWVSRIPVPVISTEADSVDEVFNDLPDGKELHRWNIFSPVWARVRVEKDTTGNKALVLRDSDPFDYALAERIFQRATRVMADFKVRAGQKDHGQLQVELKDAHGNAAIRLILNESGELQYKDGYNYGRALLYEPGRTYHVRIDADVVKNSYDLYVDGELITTRQFFAPVKSLERISFRTGDRRYYPNPDSPGKQDFDVDGAGERVTEAVYHIMSLRVSK